MPKIVINGCFGGFGLSHEAIMRYAELAGITLHVKEEYHSNSYYTSENFTDDSYFSMYDLERTDPLLVQVIEELGDEASGKYSSLHVADVPDDVEWYIHDYDGVETVHEQHRTWS